MATPLTTSIPATTFRMDPTYVPFVMITRSAIHIYNRIIPLPIAPRILIPFNWHSRFFLSIPVAMKHGRKNLIFNWLSFFFIKSITDPLKFEFNY